MTSITGSGLGLTQTQVWVMAGRMTAHKSLAIAGRIWCPLCYSGRKGRRSYAGHWGYQGRRGRVRRSLCMSYLKKPTGGSGNGSVLQVDLGAWASSWPALGEFLSAAVWPDGTPRLPGTVMLLTEGGVWKMWLHDRDSQLSSFVSAPSPDLLFSRVESQLQESSCEWRSDRRSGGKSGR